MLTRLRIATGFALAALLIPFTTTFAKGCFDFITITVLNLMAPVSQAQPAVSGSLTLLILVIVLTTGLAAFVFPGFWRRKPSIH